MKKPVGNQQDPFKRTSIHRKLVLRLVIVTVFISGVLGSSVILTQWNRVGEAILTQAVTGTMDFNSLVLPYLDQPGIPDRAGFERELRTFASRGVKNPLGRFISIRVYQLDGTRIADHLDLSYPKIEPVLEWFQGLEKKSMEDKKAWTRRLRYQGAPFLHVGATMHDSYGNAAAHIEGIFAVSDDAVTAIRLRSVKTAMAVVAIILVTALILYPTIVTLLRRVVTLSLSLLDSQLETLKLLGSAIAQRDSDTDAHNYRVTIMSVRIAEAMGLASEEIRTLIKGAFLHDVGKIGISDNILLKPGKLDDDEYTIMKTHVDHGVSIVENSHWLSDALSVVGYHHEKVSGEGYPHKHQGMDIPVIARIFAISDVFDALISKRPYKDPVPFDETMNVLEEGRGTHFDPEILDAFEGIAQLLFDELAGQDETPKIILEEIIQKYFGDDQDVLGI
jgi:HD-GYP domain-containing protein (c-di-GMP phosphodiesterase class II)